MNEEGEWRRTLQFTQALPETHAHTILSSLIITSMSYLEHVHHEFSES